MSLAITTDERSSKIYVVSLVGSLDSNTFSVLDDKVDALLGEGTVQLMIFDMKELNYISSMGVRSVLRAKKALQARKGSLKFVDLQPRVEKVFEIIRALPTQQIFASLEELDDYLDQIQKTAEIEVA